MRVVFLDMDGVLVTRLPGIAESKLVDNLRYIIEHTDAKIVLSTDWRRTPAARQEVRRILQAHGGMDYIGWTATNTSIMNNHRPMEILNWVRERNKKVRAEGWSDEELVESFVAIDDRALLQERGGDRLHGHFVMTHPNRGLTRPACEEVIKMMANKWVDKPKVGANGVPTTLQSVATVARSSPAAARLPGQTALVRKAMTPGQKALLEAKTPKGSALPRSSLVSKAPELSTSSDAYKQRVAASSRGYGVSLSGERAAASGAAAGSPSRRSGSSMAALRSGISSMYVN